MLLQVTKREAVNIVWKCNEKVKKIETDLDISKIKISILNKELQELKDNYNSLKKVKETYKKKYLQTDAELKSLQKLNQEFQETVINKMTERDGKNNIRTCILLLYTYIIKLRYLISEMFERLAAAQTTIPPGTNFAGIGAFKSDNNVRRVNHFLYYSCICYKIIFHNFIITVPFRSRHMACEELIHRRIEWFKDP